MSRYLDPTNDISFKKLFGTIEHRSLLISFLNAILNLQQEKRIKEVKLLPKEQAPLIKETKKSILDIKCTDERNFQYIVEVQNKKIPNFIKRAQFYTAHSYITQLPSGSDYLTLKPVILVVLANHILFPSNQNPISYHKTLDIDTLENHLQDLAYTFIELPKFTKTEQQLQTTQDNWLHFFANWSQTNKIPSTIKEQEIIEAYRSMEEYNWDQEEREAYIKANIALTDEFDARQKEREEGLQQGRQEGLQQGRQEGKREGIVTVARNLLKRTHTLEEVMDITGLTKEELKSLDWESTPIS